MGEALTEQEANTMRTAAYGAVTLVSIAFPAAFSTGKASVVGAKVLSGSTGLVGKILSSTGKMDLDGKSAAEIADKVFPALTSTVATLQAKAPDATADFKRIVSIAVEQSAGSTGGGINPAEAEMISKIKSALGES